MVKRFQIVDKTKNDPEIIINNFRTVKFSAFKNEVVFDCMKMISCIKDNDFISASNYTYGWHEDSLIQRIRMLEEITQELNRQ
jgi:hypothetical protein